MGGLGRMREDAMMSSFQSFTPPLLSLCSSWEAVTTARITAIGLSDLGIVFLVSYLYFSSLRELSTWSQTSSLFIRSEEDVYKTEFGKRRIRFSLAITPLMMWVVLHSQCTAQCQIRWMLGRVLITSQNHCYSINQERAHPKQVSEIS